MMTVTTTEAMEALRVALGLLGCWWFYFYVWQEYRVDAFRQRMFNLRRELFEFASEGNIGFADPAYGMLRVRMNRMIRFAHQFNAVHFVLLMVWVATDDVQDVRPHQEWTEKLERVENPEVRARLKLFEDRMAVLMVRRLVFSPIVLPIFVGFAIWLLIQGAAQATIQSLSAAMPGLERLEAHAELEEEFIAA
jgi:hypothetical protein